MRLAADRTIGHGAGREALDDLLRRLHFGNVHGLASHLFRRPDAEQPAHGLQPLGLLVHRLGESDILVLGVAAHRVLQVGNRVRVPHMRLATDALGIFAAHVEGSTEYRVLAKGVLMPAEGFLGDFEQAHALDLRRGAGEIFLHEIGGEANRIEDLCAAIGLVGRDAHLGHDLEDALVDGLDVALHRFVSRDLFLERGEHVLQRLEGEIGVDGFRAIARERAELVHLARFARLDHEANLRAQALADQMVMRGRGGEQGRDRHALGRDRAVRQDDDVVAILHRPLGQCTDGVECGFHVLVAVRHIIGDVDGGGAERVVGHGTDGAHAFEVLVGQDRLGHLEAHVRRGALEVEQVGARSDEGDERHHQLLADRVDGRVRHLREVLLEIGVERLGAVGQRRDRRVIAHGAHGLLARLGHRRHQDLEVFLGVTKSLLAIEQRHGGMGAARLGGGQVLQHDLRALQPLLVGMRGGKLLLQLFIGDDALLLEVDQQHLAGLETPLVGDVLFGELQAAHFRGEQDVPVIARHVAGRAKPVAVQRGADHLAVGEHHGGGAVPRFHEGGVIFVEGAAVLVHQRVARPCLGDQHHHGMRQRVAAHGQEFERVVEAGRVRLAFIGNGPELGEVLAEDVGAHVGLARGHPVVVSAHRVDFAVVADETIGMRQRPGRECVGREALMYHGKGRLDAVVLEVAIIGAKLGPQHEALVDQRTGGDRDRVIGLGLGAQHFENTV